MKKLHAVLSLVPVVFVCICVATTSIQAAGLTMLYTTGALTKTRLVRYAAVIYGLDLSELPTTGDQAEREEASREATRDEILQGRVKTSPLLGDRKTAVAQGTDDTHIQFQKLQSDTERFDNLRGRFETFLTQLEQDVLDKSIREVRETLAILQPKQTKDLILRMLRDEGVDDQDDVVADVVTIIRNMPEDKLKKVWGEFKADDEREKMHQIMVEIGELDQR